MTKNWIAGAIKKKGSLRKALKIKKGKKIPIAKLSAMPGDSLLMMRRKNLAKTLGKMPHYKTS